MIKTAITTTILSLCLGLASCAPPGFPRGASAEYGIIDGWVWSWRTPVQQGCVDWMATERWAAVNLSVDTARCTDGAGIDYLSGADEVVFRNYWPRGEMHGGDPCPHQISDAQIVELRALVSDALSAATTAGEQRVLRRIDARLSVTNGAALMTYHGGWCSDITPEEWNTQRRDHIAPVSIDVWQDGA